jgi:hypothetical protein
VMRVDLSAGANIAMVADRQTALPVEDYVGADPAMHSYFDIAQDQDIVVAGRTFTKSIVSSDFPSIGQQITDGNVASERSRSVALPLAVGFCYKEVRPVPSHAPCFCNPGGLTQS